MIKTIPLTITSPAKDAVVTVPFITLSGTTSPGADVAVNDKDIIADSGGKFSVTISLDEGDNDILIVASNNSGFAEWESTVTYNPTGNK